MEDLQKDFQTALQKFQTQERETIQAEFGEEVSLLKEKLDSKNRRLKLLEQENDKLKKGYQLVSDIISKFPYISLTPGETLETKEPELHSIKDRIKSLKHDPQNFTNQLSTIGKKMADYYRKAHNGEDPSKRDEKINEKHTSPVCVYSKNDWEYMDYLIKTSLEIQ